MLVAVLDEQPALLLARMIRTFSCLDQREAPAQLLALEHHVDLAASELLVRWEAILRLVCSRVPYHHSSCAVLAGGNHTLELGIFEGMVLRTYGQTLLGRVHRRPLGDRPRCQYAIDRQPEIIVQPTRVMLLNDKNASAAAPPHPPHRLRGFGKPSLPVILFECRSGHSNVCRVLHDAVLRKQHPHRTDRLDGREARRSHPRIITVQPSRTTSSGFLSSRRPRNRGCRNLPACVHSVNATWATSLGFTQWTPRRGSPSPSKGQVGVTSLPSILLRRRSVSSSNPVPTLPAYTSFRPW